MRKRRKTVDAVGNMLFDDDSSQESSDRGYKKTEHSQNREGKSTLTKNISPAIAGEIPGKFDADRGDMARTLLEQHRASDSRAADRWSTNNTIGKLNRRCQGQQVAAKNRQR